jgi:aminoglycoside 6'-N-acetyltransferase I
MPIRPVEPADAAEWLRMRCALWPDSTPAEHEAEIRAYFENSALAPAAVTFVSARDAGGLQGFVEVGLRPYADGCGTRPVGYLEGWYVDPDVRRQRVGRALVAAAEAWARAQGCREMASDTHLDNTVSRHAHARLGYAEAEHLVHFRKSLDGE